MMLPARYARRLPGEPGIWIVIFFDLLIFSALFVNYAWFYAYAPANTLRTLSTGHQSLGVLNTVILLSSSWYVVTAVQTVRGNQSEKASLYLWLAIGLGASFVAVKAFEYGELFSAGIRPGSSDYHTYYFVLTGFHLVHVLVGIGVLLWMRSRVASAASERDIQALECGAIFWHMVDLLWIMIFPLVYLI